MAFVFLAGPVTRGSRRWLDLGPFRFQPSEFGKLLLVLFLAAFLADRYKRIAGGRPARDAGRDRARARADRPRLPAARLRHRARLRRRADRGAVRRRHPLDPARRCSARSSLVARPLAALVPARGRRPRAQALPGGPPDRLHESLEGPVRLDVQREPVDHRGRRRRRARPRRQGRDADEPRLPARARDRLRLRLARRAARLPRRLGRCSCSTCSSSGADCGSSRSRATRSRRSSPAGSWRCSCSRSSSTSG